MNNNNTYKDALFTELYKQGYDFHFCETLADTMCEIMPPSGNQNEVWAQKIIKGRLKDISKAIRLTLKTAEYKELAS